VRLHFHTGGVPVGYRLYLFIPERAAASTIRAAYS
jgi:hypothetical protein